MTPLKYCHFSNKEVSYFRRVVVVSRDYGIFIHLSFSCTGTRHIYMFLCPYWYTALHLDHGCVCVRVCVRVGGWVHVGVCGWVGGWVSVCGCECMFVCTNVCVCVGGGGGCTLW